jgi:hypothetical protein
MLWIHTLALAGKMLLCERIGFALELLLLATMILLDIERCTGDVLALFEQVGINGITVGDDIFADTVEVFNVDGRP